MIYMYILVILINLISFSLHSPNQCGIGCCPGWRQTRGMCIVPVCRSPCGGSGYCYRPNACKCLGGFGPVCQSRSKCFDRLSCSNLLNHLYLMPFNYY